MKETNLNNGEIAFVINGVEVIMNVNTASMIANLLIEWMSKNMRGSTQPVEDIEKADADETKYGCDCCYDDYDDYDDYDETDDVNPEDLYDDPYYVFEYNPEFSRPNRERIGLNDRRDGILKLLSIEKNATAVDKKYRLKRGTTRRMSDTYVIAWESIDPEKADYGISQDVRTITKGTIKEMYGWNAAQWSASYKNRVMSGNRSCKQVGHLVAIPEFLVQSEGFLTTDDAIDSVDLIR